MRKSKSGLGIEIMEDFEIYLSDLKPEKQKAFLKFEGVEKAEDENYDVFPIAVIPKSEKEVEK